MRIEMLYDQGTVKIPEDQIIARLPFVGVADGVSGLYIPSEGPMCFGGRAGGQMAAETLLQTVISATEQESLEEVVLRANRAIRKTQEYLGFYSTGQIECLAGTVFAIAKVGAQEIEIIQCGDCIALWVTSQGKIGIIPNQVLSHDLEARQIIADLMRKHGGDRNKMWQEFSPVFTTMRRQRVNKLGGCGYGLLNGQLEVREMWQSFTLSRQDLTLLLLYTDGLVYLKETGQRILRLYQDGGLDTVLAETRRREREEKVQSHIDHAEASGVAITF